MWGQEYLNPEQCRILRERREYIGLTQKELAKKINVSEALFSRIVRGKEPCTAELRKELEKELDLEANSLSPANSSYNLRDREKQFRRGAVFSSHLTLTQSNDLVGLEVDAIIASLPPEMRPFVGCMVVDFTSYICKLFNINT
jgi:transcriptional regulator with XRE-family HTH domain